jgi:glycolate oxidase FAD binding subunit
VPVPYDQIDLPMSHVSPSPPVRPASASEAAAWLAANSEGNRQAIVPAGAEHSSLGLYRSPQPAVPFDLTALNRVIDYPARDLTITVEAGITWGELSRQLACEHQQLPLDVLQPDATIGGIVAANTSGPRRHAYGTARDYLLGFDAIIADGTRFKAGGRVVKNVAGYDLSKLMVGSRGTIAVLTQCTFKLKPLPPESCWLLTTWDLSSELEPVLQRLLLSDARPVAIELLQGTHLPHVGDRLTLALLLEGSATSIRWEVETLRRELSPFGPDDLVEVHENRETPSGDRFLSHLLALGHEWPWELTLAVPPSRLTTVVPLFPKTCRIAAQALDGVLRVSWKSAPTPQELAFLGDLGASSTGGGMAAVWEWTRWPEASPPPPAYRQPASSASRWSLELKRKLDPHNLLNPGVLELATGETAAT